MTKTLKAKLVVTASDGTIWSGEVELRSDSPPKPQPRQVRATGSAHTRDTALDLRLPARAFFSKFASKATAAGKFALVVAQIAGGEVGKEIDASQIEKVWNQNSGVLGGPYQTMYGTRSKEKGWVDSTKRGKFLLTDGWRQAANG